MTADELKQFCKERNLTQRELAKKIGMSADSLNNAVNQNKISKMAETAINLGWNPKKRAIKIRKSKKRPKRRSFITGEIFPVSF